MHGDIFAVGLVLFSRARIFSQKGCFLPTPSIKKSAYAAFGIETRQITPSVHAVRCDFAKAFMRAFQECDGWLDVEKE
jgi:hypothetical protein